MTLHTAGPSGNLTPGVRRLLARVWQATPYDDRFHLRGELAVRLDGRIRRLSDLTIGELGRILDGAEVTS